MTKQYDSYKPSGVEWLGDIPSHWKPIRIKDVVKNIMIGKTPKSGISEYWNNPTINWFTPTDFKSNYLKESIRKISKKGLESCGNKMLSNGDILLTTRAPIGNVAILKENGYLNQGCKGFSFNNLNHSFAFYLFKNMNNELNALGRGTTFMELSTKELMNHFIPFFNLKEQTAIAKYLDNKTTAIDGSIETLKSQKLLLIEQKKAIIHKAVTQGLDSSVPMKDSGVEWIGMVPDHLSLERLKTDLSVFSKSKIQVSEHDDDFNTPFFTSSQKLSKFVENPLINDEAIIMGTGGIANIHYFKGKFAYSTDCWVFKSKAKMVKYLYYYLLAMKSSINDIGFAGMGLQHLQKSFIYNMFIPKFNYLEQQQIVDYLDEKTSKIDEAVAEVDKQISLLKEYKKTLINDVVTGKKRVYEGEI